MTDGGKLIQVTCECGRANTVHVAIHLDEERLGRSIVDATAEVTRRLVDRSLDQFSVALCDSVGG